MKNEASFILEWVAYHRVIGFRDFLIYTNDCEDGTVEMLERLQELGVVTHEANEVLRRGPHKSALKAAKSHVLSKAADWILVSDIDEFLVVKVGDGTVQDLIAHMPPDAEVIPVTWRLFSHNDQVGFTDRLLIEQYTDAERSLENGGYPNRFVKSLFRRQKDIERFGIHGPKVEHDFVWRQPDGRKLGAGDNLTRPATLFAYDVAQINHYAVGSVDGYLVKKDRGRANHWKQDLGIDYWQRLCRGGEVDTAIQAKLDQTKAEVARLMEDPTLHALHEQAVKWRQGRIAELRKQGQFEEMRGQILKLSKSRDHHRTSDARKLAVEEAPRGQVSQDETRARLKELCRDMRAQIENLSPHDVAEIALDHLDDMEVGLFGRR